MTYLARLTGLAVGRPRAVRAVGTVLGHNPIPVLIPCHRVVRSDGALGQYSMGGAPVKREILTREGVDPEWLEELAAAIDTAKSVSAGDVKSALQKQKLTVGGIVMYSWTRSSSDYSSMNGSGDSAMVKTVA